MNKWLRRLLVIAGCICALLIIARLTGIVQVYKIPNAANFPTIQKDQKIVTLGFKKPSPGDFIAFVNPYSDTLMAYTNRASITQYVYRYCANELDTVEMKNGIFYRNSLHADEGRNLGHFYLAGKKDSALLSAVDKNIAIDIYDDYRLPDNMIVVNMADDILKKIPKDCRVDRYTQAPDTSQFGIFMWRNRNADKWNVDNFGPLVVPAGHCFVLGDNRSYALDSRYVGFVKLSNIKGVKL